MRPHSVFYIWIVYGYDHQCLPSQCHPHAHRARLCAVTEISSCKWTPFHQIYVVEADIKNVPDSTPWFVKKGTHLKDRSDQRMPFYYLSPACIMYINNIVVPYPWDLLIGWEPVAILAIGNVTLRGHAILLSFLILLNNKKRTHSTPLMALRALS